jgi:hypothetical protein
MTYFKERNGCRRPFRRPMFFTTPADQLDIVMRRRDAPDQPYAHANERPSSAQGVLFLLLSARASLLRHGAGQACLSTMDDCLSTFRLQHNVSDGEANEGVLWEETSIAALQRLLEYAHGEVTDSLSDWRCAEHLKLCIEHLKEASPA